MRKRCKTCNGTYSQDGNSHAYFHACPPIYNKITKQYEERAEKRDENPVEILTDDEFAKLSDMQRKTAKRSRPKSEGKGVENI